MTAHASPKTNADTSPQRTCTSPSSVSTASNGVQLLLRDLKLAQLAHLSPKATSTAQMWGCILGAIFNYIMMQSIVTNQYDILTSITGSNTWSGQNVQQ